ncbi:MAG TPA: sigma-70 family RNA polymerase sigma factor [Candidatus Nanoarchaeia archaeon]|nr:sigma-70 family RNA polymerase sigma factor [Candidatus Nanoarchaeia archaeon]
MASAAGLTSSGIGAGEFISQPPEDFEALGKNWAQHAATSGSAPLTRVRQPKTYANADVLPEQKPRLEELESRSDEELMRLVAVGSDDALGALFHRYRRLVHTIAIRIVHDPAEADEVVQTVFLDMYRAAFQFDPAKGSLKVWMLQYAYHRAFHRKRHLVAAHFYDCEKLEVASASGLRTEPVSQILEALVVVDEMLRVLNPRQRAVVELTYFEGLTAQEISIRLRQSVHVVRHDLRRGLSQMKQWSCGAKGTRP